MVHCKATFGLTGCNTAVDAVRATGRGTVVEYNRVKGLVFEWLRDVAYAREVYARAVERFGSFPV